MSDAVRIGILGDFNPEFRSHHATNDALQHAARKLGIEVQSEWIPTPSLVKPDAEKKLESFDGFLASPGSPYKSFEGMLKGIQFARVRDWPFLGTCGGFQYAFIEFARNVLNIADADTAENNSGSKNIIIYPVGNAKAAFPDAWKGRDDLEPSKNHAIDHLGFSVDHLQETLQRLKKDGVKVTDGPHSILGGKINSAFIEGPDHIRIELLEEHR